jgi:uncharacterized damage-inducible protein DinB
MINKQDLLKIYKKEFATTLKVLHAFPENRLDFTPHERSSNAKKLISTFIFEMYLLEMYILGEKVDNSKFQSYNPGSLQTLISDFENETSRVILNLERLSEDDLKKTIEFAGTKSPADEFALKMLFDQIHHRGQLSVYVRMAGGKVPSIYGPSADDPTTNM